MDDLTPRLIRPFWGRATVIPSPVDEDERESGLIVPLTFPGDDEVKRGVLVAVDDEWEDPERRRATAMLSPGTVVYYRGGWRIAGVVVLPLDEILAYEAAG